MNKYFRGVEFTRSDDGTWQGECGKDGQYRIYIQRDASGWKGWTWAVYSNDYDPDNSNDYDPAWGYRRTLKEAFDASLDYVQEQPDYVPRSDIIIGHEQERV